MSLPGPATWQDAANPPAGCSGRCGFTRSAMTADARGAGRRRWVAAGGTANPAHLISHGHERIAFAGDEAVTAACALPRACPSRRWPKLDCRSEAISSTWRRGPRSKGGCTAAMAPPCLPRRRPPDPRCFPVVGTPRCHLPLLCRQLPGVGLRKDIGVVGFPATSPHGPSAPQPPAVTVIHQDGDAMGRLFRGKARPVRPTRSAPTRRAAGGRPSCRWHW